MKNTEIAFRRMSSSISNSASSIGDATCLMMSKNASIEIVLEFSSEHAIISCEREREDKAGEEEEFKGVREEREREERE